MRRKIMDRGLLEFSSRGYEAGSVNNICAEDGISKGIIYHYFKTKDDLYLACVEECFHLLTDHLKTHALCRSAVIEEQLREYFLSRGDFFREHPVYRRIFCDAIMSPPPHIKDEIATRTHDFDEINRLILEKMLGSTALREDITKEEVIDIFRLFQDFINAKYPSGDASAQEFEMRDEICYKAMGILGTVYIPFILILPRLWGITGIYLCQPAADVLTILVCLFSIKAMKRTASINMSRSSQ